MIMSSRCACVDQPNSSNCFRPGQLVTLSAPTRSKITQCVISHKVWTPLDSPHSLPSGGRVTSRNILNHWPQDLSSRQIGLDNMTTVYVVHPLNLMSMKTCTDPQSSFLLGLRGAKATSANVQLPEISWMRAWKWITLPFIDSCGNIALS